MFQKNMRARTGARSMYRQEKWLVQAGDKEQHAQEEERPSAQNREERARLDIEQRLSAYYGPALPTYPLPDVAWLRLRHSLSLAEQARRPRFVRPAHRSQQARQAVPIELQQAYATLLLQTNYRHPAPALRVRLSSRPVQPRVRTGALGRRQIGLVLPRENWQTLQKAELDMLLATGLARCSSVSRILFLLPRLLFAISLCILGVLPFTGMDRRAVWIFLLAVACCLLSGRVLIWQQRALAFRGDRQAVQWLGRERVCLGLHLLAEHGRPQRRPAWGEPSLVERISRVCGTPIAPNDKRLTLVG